MRLSKKLGLILAAIVIVVAAAIRYLFLLPAGQLPLLQGNLQRGELSSDGRQRGYSYYKPDKLSRDAPVVMVFHGSRGTGDRVRQATAGAFDVLADLHDFIVVYPNAYQGHWNDCCVAGNYSARKLEVDDVAFIRRLLTFLQDEHGTDPDRVLSVGVSGGGQMSLRLAMEAPELIRAVAAIGANMPALNNLVCRPAGEAVAAMFINGTDDPINPFDGGEVSWPGGFGGRGMVRSSLESVQYWALLAGYESDPFQHRFPDSVAEDNSVATRMVWADSGLPEISLITVHGGGHTIPSPENQFPRFLGPVNRDFAAVDEIWRFFQRELDRAGE